MAQEKRRLKKGGGMKDHNKNMLKNRAKLKNQKIEEFSFANGLVKGELGIDGENLTIYEWRCYDEKSGHTIRALKSLRQRA